MKNCPFCNAELEDSVRFCRNCGTAQPGADYLTPGGTYAAPALDQGNPEPEKDPYDHTEEFQPEDISAGKLYAMLVYLLGLAGLLVVLLGAKDSGYGMFHIKQGLKLVIVESLLTLAAAVLSWTFIVPIGAAVCLVILLVVRFICFLRVCRNRVVEAPIVRGFDFLK